MTRTLLRAIFDVALQPETATLLESFLVARASAAALAVGVGNTSAVFAEPAPSRQTIDKLLLGARRALPNERAGTCLYDRLRRARAGPGQDRHSDSPPHLDEAVSLLTAGRDTTAAALAWTLLTIARRPAIAERVAHEVTAWTRENPAHPGHAELPYLNTVIQESLRLFPPNWLLVVREAVENVELGGRTIPAQSRVSILPIVVHRDNRWFNHPEEFLPERFVASRRPPIRPGTYIPFGLGPRSCLGTRWATTIVRSAVAATVQRFTLADPSPQSALAAEATIVVKPARSTRLAIQRKTPWTAS